MAQVAGAGDDEGLRGIAAAIEANLNAPAAEPVAPAPPDVASPVEAAPEPEAGEGEPLEPPLALVAEPEPEPEPDATTPWTAAELAEATGLSLEQFEQQFVTEVEGHDAPLSLAELRRRAKSETELVRRAQEVSEERRQLEEARAHYQAQFAEGAQDSLASIRREEEAQRQLQEQMNTTNWQQVEAESGAAGVMQTRQAYEQLWQGHEQTKNTIRTEHSERHARMRDDAARAQKEAVAQAVRELPGLVPEWKDDARRNADIDETLRHLVTERGFPREMVEATIDPRMLALAYDGMRYRRLQPGGKSNVAAKKVAAKVARSFKPAAKRAPADAETQRVGRIKSRLKNTGSVRDLAALRMEGFKKAR